MTRRSQVVRPSAPARTTPTTTVEEIQHAVDQHDVSFSMVVRALYLQRPEFSDDESGHERRRCRELYPLAVAEFMDAHGGILESFYAEHLPAGVALTGSYELFSSIWWQAFAFDTTAAREVEAGINELRLKFNKFVSGSDRRAMLHRTARFYSVLIASLEAEHGRWKEVAATAADVPAPSEQYVADLRELRTELDRMWRAYLRVGTMRGQAQYIGGAASGVFVIVAVSLTFWTVTGHDGGTIWPGVVAGGSLGALFSVLERLTRGALSVRFESDSLVIGGVSRPIVGTIAGLAMYALIAGGVLPIDVPEDETSGWLFFAAIAFLSGFSERFAKDAFGSAAESLEGGIDGGATTAHPEAAAAPPGDSTSS